MKWDERFNVFEDESGKFHYPRFMVEDNQTNTIVAGPFDTESEAIDAAGELSLENYPCP